MDCETVYVQMLFLLFKGCLCVLYHFCASYTCISPLFKFSSVQFKMVFRRSKKPLCTLVQDGIYALKKPHMHSSSVQDGIYALKKAHMHSSSVQDGIYALKKAHMHSSSGWYLCTQKSPYALKFSSGWYLCTQKSPYALQFSSRWYLCTQKSPYALQFSSRWYLCPQKNPYALHPVSHSLRDVCGMCHVLLRQFINTMHFPAA